MSATRSARIDRQRQFVLVTCAFGVLAVDHAAYSWGVLPALRFAAVAFAVAFVGELVVVQLGVLVHHTGPRFAGVPLVALFGWTGSIYVSYRLASLVADPAIAPFAAALLATASDALTDPVCVRRGFWGYPPSRLSVHRFRGVPWWNFAGWFCLTALVSWLGTPAA